MCHFRKRGVHELAAVLMVVLNGLADTGAPGTCPLDSFVLRPSGLRAARPTVFACVADPKTGEQDCNDWVSSPTHNFNFTLATNTSLYPEGSQ